MSPNPDPTKLHGHLSDADALKLAQQAPALLKKNPRAFSTSPLVSLFSASETADLWVVYEAVLQACLRVGDDQSAHRFVDRLALRFGQENERIMALKGLVKETVAEDDEALKTVLAEYDVILEENPANIPIAKRKVALLRSVDKVTDAITSLKHLLEISPTDPEAWSELSDMYLSQGIYPQAIFALEEALVLVPTAWNMHARLGEVLLMAADAGAEGSSRQQLAEALKRFSRSVELCDDYLRGYYGLKRATDVILADVQSGKERGVDEGFAVPDRKVVELLNEAATEKLGEIVRRHAGGDKGWQGYNADEISAARALLQKAAA